MYKSFCTTPQANSNSSGVSCTYEIVILLLFSCKISHIYNTLQNFSRIYLIIFICTRSAAYTYPKYLKKGSFRKSISKRSKISLKYCCFSISTINSMDGVLCSFIVSERLKMRKSLAINY